MEISRYARLDKTGRRVLCSQVICGFELAQVDDVNVYDLAHGAAVTMIQADGNKRTIGPDDWLRVLRLPPGWVRDAETAPWRMTRHAWERVKTGKRPRYRRRYAVAPGGTYRQHPRTTPLPGWIVCPSCGCEQGLDQERLQLTPLPISIRPV